MFDGQFGTEDLQVVIRGYDETVSCTTSLIRLDVYLPAVENGVFLQQSSYDSYLTIPVFYTSLCVKYNPTKQFR